MQMGVKFHGAMPSKWKHIHVNDVVIYDGEEHTVRALNFDMRKNRYYLALVRNAPSQEPVINPSAYTTPFLVYPDDHRLIIPPPTG